MSVPNVFAAVNSATGQQLDQNFAACAQLNANNAFSGTNTAPTQSPGDNSTNLATTAYVATAVTGITATPLLPTLSVSVSLGALTVGAAAITLAFRNPSYTASPGTPEVINCTNAATVMLGSGDSLGVPSGGLATIQVVELYNGGSPVLGLINGTVDETLLIVTTYPANGSRTTANQVVTATGVTVTNSPVRVIGQVILQWSAGWNTINSITPLSSTPTNSLGYGQSWQTVTGSRSGGSTYYNTTGKPIEIAVYNVAGFTIFTWTIGGATTSGRNVIVPAGQSYVLTGGTFTAWYELRT